MAAALDFKRVLVNLQQAPEQTTRLAAELASLLRLDLLGLFVQEQRLLDLAALPFAREFSPVGGWRRIETERLSSELDLAARRAERMFMQAVRGLETPCRFEIVKEPMAEGTSISGRDIVIVPEPSDPAERATRQIAALLEAAARSSAAVMLAPRHVARRSGSIVAIAAEPGDASIATATSIAAAAREPVAILAAYEGRVPMPGSGEQADTRPMPASIAKAQLSDKSGIMSAFHDLQERLVVLTRGAFDESVPLRIASVRRNPVLVVDRSNRTREDERISGAAQIRD
jgi:hypothetical protein